MKRLLLLCIFIALAVFSGCLSGEVSAPPSNQSEGSGSAQGLDALSGVVFEVEPIENGIVKAMEFNMNSDDKPGYEIDLLPDAGFWPIGGDEWSENYTVVEPGGEGSMLISLLSCPSDPVGHFGLEDEGGLDDKLIAYIFSTNDRYTGQKRAVSDFDYILTMDHYGEREGWRAFHIEFSVPESKTRSVRFLSANDNISSEYAGVSVRIDLPMDSKDAYENYMYMLNSIRRTQK